MKVLQVIHGYPPRYNAGSEVYTQALSHGLAARHEVHVFTRAENTFLPDLEVLHQEDASDQRVRLHVVNLARARDKYRQPEVDQVFGLLLDELEPDIIHVGHLNHLSTSLIQETHRRSKPIVFTLHDFWLLCPRGQFIQSNPQSTGDVWALCDGQEDRKCAERCYSRYHSGAIEDRDRDIDYWSGWVGRRMAHLRDVCEAVDLFIAPSQYLLERFRTELGISENKLLYLDYGFDTERLSGRQRVPGEPFTFGFLGTHIPAKGLHHLIEAFGMLRGDSILRIWGAPRGAQTQSLHALADARPVGNGRRIEWMGEYQNQDIVPAVFNLCDAVVVPSIWAENSPLVIHEALQVRVPVITANYGGMAEYVRHEENGLLFAHRNPQALAQQMQRLLNDPDLARQIGQRGYLQSEDGNAPSMAQHVAAIEEVYYQAIAGRAKR